MKHRVEYLLNAVGVGCDTRTRGPLEAVRNLGKHAAGTNTIVCGWDVFGMLCCFHVLLDKSAFVLGFCTRLP